MTPAADHASIDVVVTYLEMTAPPSRPAAPAPGGFRLTLMRAERPDPGFYRYLYGAVGRRWLWVDRAVMSAEALIEILADPRVEVYVLYVAGVPAGYAELDRRVEGEVELAYFGLTPDCIGRGLGRYLLDWAVAAAWTSAPQRVWVHTCSLDHPRALQAYQRAGFRVYRQEHETIDDAARLALIARYRSDQPAEEE